MTATNFTVRDAIYIVCGGHECDLHNWYEFRSLTHDVQAQELRLTWAKRAADGIPLDNPTSLTLAFQQVTALEFRPRDPSMPFTEDDCLANLGYLSDALGIPGVFTSDKKPDDEWKWVFGFMSGAQIVVQAKTVEAITEHDRAGKPIYTRMLSVEEVESVLKGLPALMRELAGDCILIAEYGCACNIHNDLQCIPMQVGIGWLDRFLAKSKDQGIFVPAKTDLSITTPNGGLTILFCHESDIHLSGQDATLVEKATQSNLIRPLLITDPSRRN